MLYLRLGPRFLFIRTDDVEGTKLFLQDQLGGKITDFLEGMDEASENSTLFFLTERDKEKTSIEDTKAIILVNDSTAISLTKIINNHGCKYINRIDMGPAALVMRIAGDEKKILHKLKEEYQGQLLDIEEGITQGEKEDTLLFLTPKPLNNALQSSDIISPALLLPYPISVLHKRLRVDGLRLITENLENGQWYEIKINIYDSSGNYQLHYDRLMFVLSKLEVGMILGESWTQDYAFGLMSVLAYQVRLFTFYTPQEIKKLLAGLEYTQEGTRLVDFDLYYKNKKLSWSDVKDKKEKITKIDFYKKSRQELYRKLSSEDIIVLEGLEKGI